MLIECNRLFSKFCFLNSNLAGLTNIIEFGLKHYHTVNINKSIVLQYLLCKLNFKCVTYGLTKRVQGIDFIASFWFPTAKIQDLKVPIVDELILTT